MRLKNLLILCGKVKSSYKFSSIFIHHQTVDMSVSRAFSKWDLVGAVCLERKPVITQSLSPLEQKYLKYIQKIEVERSLLSEHEKRFFEDKIMSEKLKAGTLEDSDVISKQTAQDFEDACIEEFNKFTPASRVTEADITCNRRSAQRKLDSSLVFIIQQKLGNDYRWFFPHAVHEEGETLKQTAERALYQVVANNYKVLSMGNAPVGYYKYKYPKAVRENGVCGAKVFFFKVQLVGIHKETLLLKDTIKDYLWLSHAELEEILQPLQLYKTVRSFLYPDSLINEFSQQIEDENEQLSIHSQG